jgi:hypothetical protein
MMIERIQLMTTGRGNDVSIKYVQEVRDKPVNKK